MNTKLTAIKNITSWTAGIGAGIIIDRLIEENVSEPDKLHQKVAVKVGAFALGGMIADHVKTYTDHAIDEIFAGIREITQPKSTDK